MEKDLIEIECAIKSQREKDNMFTVSVLQRCYKLVSQLKEYKDLEEQGKLLKLPVAVGDTVYRVRHETFVERCSILGFAESRTVCYMVYIDPDEEDVIELSDFGKTVFLTREEAEAALKELERGKGE